VSHPDAANLTWRRRLGRLVLRPLMTLSLAVSVGSLGFWYRAGDTIDTLTYRGEGQLVQVRSIADRLMILGYDLPTPPEDQGPRWLVEARPLPEVIADGWEPGPLKLVGLEFGGEPLQDVAPGGWWLRIKWWTLAFLAALPPLGWALAGRIRHARQERLAAGLCPGCGEDPAWCRCET
jgi:hypothetical protein